MASDCLGLPLIASNCLEWTLIASNCRLLRIECERRPDGSGAGSRRQHGHTSVQRHARLSSPCAVIDCAFHPFDCAFHPRERLMRASELDWWPLMASDDL